MAHFKLELISTLANGAFGDAVGLPEAGLIGYDITDQVVPAYGRDVIDRDLGPLLNGDASHARWWGGEFIVGCPAAFAALGNGVRRLWPAYLAHHRSFHHVGDEIVTSAAIAKLATQGHAVADAGRAGGVVRWWSAGTLSPQPTLEAVLDRSLLHLPADKTFLAAEASRPFAPEDFLRRYRANVRRKLLIRRAVAPVQHLLGRRDGRLLPRLA